MKSRMIIFFIIVIASLSSCYNNTSTNHSQEELTVYEDKNFGFTVSYPKEWGAEIEKVWEATSEREGSPDGGIKIFADENKEDSIRVYGQSGHINIPEDGFKRENFSTKTDIEGYLLSDMDEDRQIYHFVLEDEHIGAYVNVSSTHFEENKERIMDVLRSIDITKKNSNEMTSENTVKLNVTGVEDIEENPGGNQEGNSIEDTFGDDYFDITKSKKVMNLNEKSVVYYGKYRNLFVRQKDKNIVLTKCFSTYPEISPDGSKFAYLDYVDFETISNVHIYDKETGTTLQITSYEYEQKPAETPKVVKWLDNENLLLIIGFPYGTVSQGGDLYVYNIDQDELDLVLQPEDRSEVKDIEVVGDDLNLTLVHFDEQYNGFTLEEKKMSRDELFD